MIKASCQVRTKWHNNSNSGNRQLHNPIPWSLVTHQSARTILHSSLTDPLGPVTVSLSSTLTDWVGGGLSHGNYFPYISKTTSTGARISNCSWDYLRAGETDTALMVTYVALMECQGLMQDSIHTHKHTHTHTAPTKDSCVKLMENRIVWAVDLWLYIQPHKARSGVEWNVIV